jgi:hypothetical protein
MQKGHSRTRWKLDAQKVSLSFPGAFKTCINLGEGKNLVIPNYQ